MSRMSRAIFIATIIATVTLGCWLSYAALAFAAEQQRLPSGAYGELYGPIAWLRDTCFWVGLLAAVSCAAAVPALLRGRTHAG